MEISGIGGYKRDFAVRSSFTSVDTTLTDVARMLERPSAPRSVGSGVSEATQRGRRWPTDGAPHQRASEPILLDFDLPSTVTTTQSSQRAQPPQQKQNSKCPVSSSSRPKHQSSLRLDNLQPSVNMSDARRAEYKQILEDRIASALLKSQAAWNGTSGIFDDDPKNWKLHVNKPNLTMYRRRNEPTGSDRRTLSSNNFVASGRIPGVTLEDLEYGLYVATTPGERALSAYWYGENFLDAGILETYETRTDDDPFRFFGVKWLLAGPLLQANFIAPRVSSFVQFQKTVIDEFGEKVLVRVADSVPEDIVAHIPDQGKITFVPLEFAIIYMYRYDAKAKCVQVFCEGHLKPTTWMPDVNHTMLAGVIVDLKHIADAKYITKHGLMFPHESSSTNRSTIALSVSTYLSSPNSSREDTRLLQSTPKWVPDRHRKVCVLCFKGFSLLRRRRHHCRMCGEVMCTDCMATLPLVAPPAFDASKDVNFPLTNQPPSKMLDVKDRRGLPVVHHIKFCSKCLLGIRQERRAMVAGVGNYYFTEGMRHHYTQMQAAFAAHNNNDQFEAEYEEDACACVESGYLDSTLEEDDDDNHSDVAGDQVQYSKRIEKLRQDHMAREKLKLRDRRKNDHHHHHYVRGASIQLIDEATVSLPSSSSASRKHSTVSEFDDFEISKAKPPVAADTSDSERHSSLMESTTSKATFASTMPLPSTSSSSRTTDIPEKPTVSATRGTLLLSLDTRRRSLSIPDHFEMLERSIAEQEALISSIQQQWRNQTANQQGESRLPIGAMMRSIVQTKPSVLSSPAVKHSVDNQAEVES